jgi:hypothetical protein
VDTEPGFGRKLKAIQGRFRRVFQGRRLTGLRADWRQSAESQETAGEDAGEFAESFIGRGTR